MFRWHAEQAFAVAGLGPHGPDGTLGTLAFIEVASLVFDNQNATVVEHGDEIGIKLLVRKLEPERCPFARDTGVGQSLSLVSDGLDEAARQFG